MIADAGELLVEMQARGLVPADATATVREPVPARPWFVGLLLGIAGWIAGICILIFVVAAFKIGSGTSGIFIGPVLLAAAWGLYRIDRDGAFVSQLALALSIAGQIAIVFALSEGIFKARTIEAPAFVALIVQLVLVVVMPNRLHRAMSTLFACLAWAVFVRYSLSHPFETRYMGAGTPPVARPLAAWLFTWLPVAGALAALVIKESAWMAARRQSIARPLATGLIVSLAIGTLVSDPMEALVMWESRYSTSGWLTLWPVLSALAAIGALVAAFALGQRALAAVCIAAALLHVSHFYYAMGIPLLAKAVFMIVLGAALVFGARRLRRGAAA